MDTDYRKIGCELVGTGDVAEMKRLAQKIEKKKSPPGRAEEKVY